MLQFAFNIKSPVTTTEALNIYNAFFIHCSITNALNSVHMLLGWQSEAQPTTASNISNNKKNTFTKNGRSLLPHKNDSDQNLTSNEVMVTYITTHTNQ